MKRPPLRPDDESVEQRTERQRRQARLPVWIDSAHDEAWCGQAVVAPEPGSTRPE